MHPASPWTQDTTGIDSRLPLLAACPQGEGCLDSLAPIR